MLSTGFVAHSHQRSKASFSSCVPIYKSSRGPLKTGCRTLPSADFARYSISASSSGSTQMPRCAIFLAKGWFFRISGFRRARNSFSD